MQSNLEAAARRLIALADLRPERYCAKYGIDPGVIGKGWNANQRAEVMEQLRDALAELDTQRQKDAALDSVRRTAGALDTDGKLPGFTPLDKILDYRDLTSTSGKETPK